MTTSTVQVNDRGLTDTRVRLRRDRVFFSTLAALFLAAVFYGFAQSYYLYGLVAFPAWKRAFAPPHAFIVEVHGAVLTAWFVLLIVQTGLVAAHHVRLHKRLGVAGAVLACLVVLVSFLTVCEHMARSFAPGDPRIAGRAAGTFNTNLDLIPFAVLVYLGVRYRSRPAAHKRLMLMANLSLLPPALTRWPVPIHGHFQTSLNVTYGLVALVVLYDLLSTRRVHPATAGAGLVYIAIRSRPLASFLANNTTWWLHLAIHAQNLGQYFR